ncbi:aminotransferase class V-fold PLP-dependent enzyme [Polyangium sp. 15x6]|uniref:aminotransferase class V-fold PLP-dependent enzyme n=1 Tax=Polyangium sp. 15x6 TaxID=3042687 RepID=UPI00249B1B1F|nr:aminotransferase class V-fold PLP-dependent enzyme [Polyangium sp. 15x6]MDI3288664.1 aminotransferase class V-fold PLP-dependent enzyme [Polyangium sp. 15x6]
MTTNFAPYRQRFPVFAERNYLASQSIGPLPAEGLEDLTEYIRSRALNNRAIGTWYERVEEMTGLIAKLLHTEPATIALRDNATACQAAIAASIHPGPVRRRIITTALDFHSSLHLWNAQAQRGFEVVEVPSSDGSSVSEEAILREIDERTAIVAVSLVSRYNARLDVRALCERTRAVGAVLLLDAYQAVGIVPLDVTQLGADVVVGGVHKWLSGSTGLAFMYVDPSLSDKLEPAYPGWFAHRSLDAFVTQKTFEDAYLPRLGARRFQQGTPGLPSIYGSRAGLRFALEVGVESMERRNTELCALLHDGALERGFEVVTPRAPSLRAGGVCIAVPEPESVVQALAERGIDIDQRRHEVLRVAPHPCTTEQECIDFLDTLAELCPRAPGRVRARPPRA